MIPALILALTLTSTIQAQTETHEEMTVPLSSPGKPCKVKIESMYGSIKVIGSDVKEVVVGVETEKKEEGSAGPGGMKRLGGGSAEVTASEDDNTVTVSAGLSQVKSITVKVPMNTAGLTLSTVNNGDIWVKDVNAQIEVNNVNGRITCDDVSGSVVANTVNGDVSVIFKTINPQAAMAFSTLNGKIDVTFPATLKAKLKLKSDQGDIFSDFDVAIDKGKQPTAPEKTDGSHMYKIEIDDWVYGTVGGGGPEIMMKTFQGSIYVRKAKQ